jgi:hypothetical protein
MIKRREAGYQNVVRPIGTALPAAPLTPAAPPPVALKETEERATIVNKIVTGTR